MIMRMAFTLLISLFSLNVLATQLNIEISHKVIDGKVFINGFTNLPMGTKIGVNISSTSNSYSAQSYNLFVQKDGAFRSDGFTDKGKLLIGSYQVEVTSYINTFWQNKDILKKLIKYRGNAISDDEISVKYSMNIGSLITQPGNIKPSQSFENKSFEKATKLWSELKAMRYDEKFIYYGYSLKSKGGEWEKRRTLLSAEWDAYLKTLPLNKRLNNDLTSAMYYMWLIGKDWWNNNGKDTKSSIDLSKDVENILSGEKG